MLLFFLKGDVDQELAVPTRESTFKIRKRFCEDEHQTIGHLCSNILGTRLVRFSDPESKHQSVAKIFVHIFIVSSSATFPSCQTNTRDRSELQCQQLPTAQQQAAQRKNTAEKAQASRTMDEIPLREPLQTAGPSYPPIAQGGLMLLGAKD